MTNRFLAIGECMVELSPLPGDTYAMGFAGDTFNTAWYVRQLSPEGSDVAYLSAIGRDAISERMAGFMTESGVRPILARHADATVGLYMISLSDGERSFSYWRSDSAARRLTDGLETLPDLGPGDMAYFSGITLAILPESRRAHLLSMLKAARAGGVRIAFDPNLRPRLWRDGDEMRDWVTRGAEVADIALPSFADEAAHFGDADPEATAARYRALGVGMAVVKDDVNPVRCVTAAGSAMASPTPVARPVDTTAAGDSFNAGFLVAMGQGADPVAAMRAGCDLAAHVVSHRGALVPPATRETPP